MIEINPAQFKTPAFAHQLAGVRKLVDNEAFALFDEMGAGKSKQVIDAACTLAVNNEINRVIIVAPASVRCVWLDKEIGEIRKHSWLKNTVCEFHSKFKLVWEDDRDAYNLSWIVTNYEFLRSPKRLEEFSKVISGNNLLVLDESSYIKSRTAQQTKATLKLRQLCKRCILLNGTPVTNSPLDLWSQMEVLSPKILKRTFHNFYHFRSEYAEMITDHIRGRRSFQRVVRYRRLDDLSKKLAPYVLRREKKNCLDLPEKLYTQREVALTPESWRRYKELKKDALLTLENGDLHLEPNAAVRIMRLGQLTSGHLGGITSNDQSHADPEVSWQDLSNEKLCWCVEYLTNECTAKAVIVWCRWRRERERLVEALGNNKSEIIPYELYGGQKKKEREEAIEKFSTVRDGEDWRCVLVAQPHAGGLGLNLVAATEAIYLSNDYSSMIRKQSEDRCHRPGQHHPVTYIDVLATGPNGEKTVDHTIVKALRSCDEIAQWTQSAWRKALSDE